MERIGLTTSEEMSFENVDGQMTDGRRTDGRTSDACIYYKLTYEPCCKSFVKISAVAQQYKITAKLVANAINVYVTFNLLMVLEKQTFSKINY